MTSRRDQLQSYQFRNQRVISAFVARETDPTQSPQRRGIGSLFAGLMVAVLIAAGFGVYGLLTGTGGDDWKTEGAVVVEKETGASFVHLSGRLVPTLNLASAKLASGRPGPPVYRIAASSLAGTPRGATIGIPGAPDSLPPPDRQVRLPWTMCTDPNAVLLLGSPGPPADPLGDRGLLVTDGDLTHLVVQGLRHRIRNARVTVPGLFGATQPSEVSPSWLTTLPTGDDIAPIDVDGRGDESDAVPGRDNGDILFTETASGRQFYLVLNDGLAPVTPLQQAVLNAAFPSEPSPVSVNDVAGSPTSNAVKDSNAPATVPELVPLEPGSPACATTKAAADPPVLTVGGSPSVYAAAVPIPGDPPLADAVQVPGGSFALIRAAGTLLFITDQGIRHEVPTPEALRLLGYEDRNAIEVPQPLLNALPEGPRLDPAAVS
ncbi:type VII secretion protein EccB [Actinoplanes sp. NPDC051861]|uniref:type VII secretion protein EccB n=1 Tax=Actinoplanes sp. NPDC051861 TaxID=3155170 RepID=UPI0034462445